MFHIYTDGACRNNQDAQKRTAAWAFIVFDQNMQRKGSKSAFLGNATNNEAERLLRNYKRKQAQAVTFRSFESIDYAEVRDSETLQQLSEAGMNARLFVAARIGGTRLIDNMAISGEPND